MRGIGHDSRTRIVVLVATTDRPEPFARLSADLADAAAGVEVPVTLGLVENSRVETSRAANAQTVAELRARGLEVVVSDGAPGGRSIGDARTRQREILRSLVAAGRDPAFVWMLDDDLRLARAVVRRGLLSREALLDPFGGLLELGRRPDAPDVLVGCVHGDPPIPALATWASRMSDLAANVERMVELGIDAVWAPDGDTIRRLGEPDYYYDYGRHPELTEPAFWLPRQGGQPTSVALRDLIEEARHLPCGVALTRPLVDVETFQPTFVPGLARVLGPAQVRGGNTVFYDSEACLGHDYPMAEVAGVRTRRSDSVGMLALRAARGTRIASSDFALLHERDRDVNQWPSSDQLVSHLLADTLGAALTRAVDGTDAEALCTFLQARVSRIELSLGWLNAAITRVRKLARESPAWVEESGLQDLALAPDGVLHWFETSVPGLDTGRLPEPARSTLLAPASVDELTRVAAACTSRATHNAERT